MKKTIFKNISILRRELTYKNDESLKKVLQVIEQLTILVLASEITLDELEHYTYLVFDIYEKLEPH